jgi:hypothetical protein
VKRVFDSGFRVMPDSDYALRQAQFLLRFAKSTSDPELSTKLISKAADLLSQSNTLRDVSVAPPDVELDNRTNVIGRR